MLNRFVIGATWWWMIFCCVVSSVAFASDKDAKLERALDQYRLMEELLSDSYDVEAAKALLQQLEQTDIANPALQSRVRLLSYLVKEAQGDQNLEKANALLEKVLLLADKTHNPNILSEIYGTEIWFLWGASRQDEAIAKADKLERILQQATEPRIRYFYFRQLGYLYGAEGQDERALKLFQMALQAIESSSSEVARYQSAWLKLVIAEIYRELNDIQTAQELEQQFLVDAQTLGLKEQVRWGYFIQVRRAFESGLYEDAIKIAKAALTPLIGDSESSTDSRLERVLKLQREEDIGDVLYIDAYLREAYLRLARYSDAKPLLEFSLEIAKRFSSAFSDSDLQHISIRLAFIALMQDEDKTAIAQMEHGLEYLRQHEQLGSLADPDNKLLFSYFSQAYRKTGLHEKHADFLQQHIQLLENEQNELRALQTKELNSRTTVLNNVRAQEISLLQQKNALNEQLLQSHQQRQQLAIGIAVILSVAAMTIFLLYRKVRHANHQLQDSNQQLTYQSQRDPLTGLFNRRALQQFMATRGHNRRDSDTSAGVTGLLLLDIDFFKRINDGFGHNAGDAVLIAISERLQAACREHDKVIRWGGEEIMLVVQNVEPTQSADLVKRVLGLIGDTPIEFEQHSIRVTASGGFIHLPFSGITEQALDWEKLMQLVDQALYLSKENGRNQVMLINDLNVSLEQAEPYLFTELKRAIEQGMINIERIHGPDEIISQQRREDVQVILFQHQDQAV